jgi:hypothetical protein
MIEHEVPATTCGRILVSRLFHSHTDGIFAVRAVQIRELLTKDPAYDVFRNFLSLFTCDVDDAVDVPHQPDRDSE